MEKSILALASQLMAIRSVAADRQARRAVLACALQELKEFKVRMFEHDASSSALISNGYGHTTAHRIILNAHLDVVPGEDSQFSPQVKDGNLYGRGAIDMKAGAAVLILIFKHLAPHLNFPIALQLVTDEETGGSSGTAYQIAEGVRADFVIAGEPTNLALGTESKGVFVVDLFARGRTAHASELWKGDNAVAKLLPSIRCIQRTFPIPPADAWRTTANLSWIKTSNTASNKVPEEASARIDFRYIPEEGKSIREKIKSLIADDVSLEVYLSQQGQKIAENHGDVKKLVRAVEETTGQNAEFVRTPYASDVRYFTAHGMPAITFGPVGVGLHSDDESVDIPSLTKYYAILENFLKSLGH